MRLLLLCLGSYALGCLNGGYYIVRLRSGQDVRQLGSGTAGARNVLRTRGRGDAVMTIAWDMARGAVAVLAARLFAPNVPGAEGLATMLLVIGHIWPAQLGFRGGKGAAPLSGAMLVLAPGVALACIGIAALLLLVTRQFTWAGLAAVAAAAPLMAITRAAPPATLAGAGAACAIVLCVHHPAFARRGRVAAGGGDR